MITSASIKAKEKEREQIANSVDEFLARGGKVEIIEPSASAGIKPAICVGSEEVLAGGAGWAAGTVMEMEKRLINGEIK